MTTSQANPHSVTQRRMKLWLYLVALVIVPLVFFTCTPITIDYSAYSGTNLIPNGQFSSSAASPAAGWSADEALTPYASAVNMWYEQVSTPAGANPSGDSFAGYTSNALLRTGLATLADGTNPPIFRLETKNLFINGDFEGAGGTFSDIGTTVRSIQTGSSAPGPIGPALSASYYLNHSWMEVNFTGTSAAVAIPLAANLPGGYNSAAPLSLSFTYALQSPNSGYLTLDNAAHNLSQTNPQPTFIVINSSPNSIFRFPFTSPAGTSSALLNPTGTGASDRSTLYINNLNIVNFPGIHEANFVGTFDDFQFVRSDVDNALRLDIPWVSAGRPSLQVGGHYTVKLWVRADKTTNYSGALPVAAPQQANRFATDFITISLHQNMGSTSSHGVVVVHSVGSSAAWAATASSNGWTNHSDINNWTQIIATFNGPSAQSSGIQLTISTTNMASGSFRSAGSVLIANPQLYWSEN